MDQTHSQDMPAGARGGGGGGRGVALGSAGAKRGAEGRAAART